MKRLKSVAVVVSAMSALTLTQVATASPALAHISTCSGHPSNPWLTGGFIGGYGYAKCGPDSHAQRLTMRFKVNRDVFGPDPSVFSTAWKSGSIPEGQRLTISARGQNYCPADDEYYAEVEYQSSGAWGKSDVHRAQSQRVRIDCPS